MSQIDIDEVYVNAILCGNSNVHFVAKNFDGIPNAALVQRSICNYLMLAAKSFAQCINEYETVQKQVENVEISTKVDDFNLPGEHV